VIICYHKTRKVFYVVKSNKPTERKFLYSSKNYEDCRFFAGEGYRVARSAARALGVCHPTNPTPLSDAVSRVERLEDLPTTTTIRHPSDEREEDHD
jgi:hypothetical protein